MIEAIFTVTEQMVCGFRISGHADFAEQGSDIVCAAVSSAAYMTANTITEVQSLRADITEEDGILQVILSPQEAAAAQEILNGLLLHLNALSEQYQEYIKVVISEV
ncbi:MAG: ribosomal-processing cysteine protease Prp [Ruminococcus sp.]|nr:ribosomal-processing cysteine protease Prp [Ruminococcus sp.]